MIKLGQVVRDTITGCDGKVIAITEWLYGCRRIMIQPKGNKETGGPLDAFITDEPQCEVIEDVPDQVEPAVPQPARHGGRDDSVATRRR